MSGSPSVPPSSAATIAAEFYRLKAAAEAASLQHLQEQRQSVRRLVQLQQNKAFGLPTDVGLEAMRTPGSIHVGDIYAQPASPTASALIQPGELRPQASPLAKLAVGAAAAAAGLGIPVGAGLAVSQLGTDDQPVAVQSDDSHPSVDTIGVLEPDRN